MCARDNKSLMEKTSRAKSSAGTVTSSDNERTRRFIVEIRAAADGDHIFRN